MAEQDNTLLSSDNLYTAVEGEDGKELNLELDQRLNLVGVIRDRFKVAEDARITDEKRWIKAYENYRGLYGKTIRFRESEKSRVFVKITKTKVLAAFGQLVDVVFGTGKFPIGITETKIPEGEREHAHLDTENPVPGIETTPELATEEPVEAPIDNPYDVGYAGDGKVLKPGATLGKGLFEESLEDNAENAGLLAEGLVPIPQIPELSPAQLAARRMEKLIHDQIEESSGSSEIRNALLEAALLGTGVIKGPFNFNKTLNRWTNDEGERQYKPLEVRVPRIEFVSLWDFFPDPSATNIEECEYAIHRHKMNRSQFRALKNLPYFDKDAIRECLLMGANYEEKYYENQLRDNDHTEGVENTNYEVLEYWGVMDAQSAREAGIEVGEDVDELDELQINAWITGNKVLRVVVNPFTPHRLPYHSFPYERNPYNFFGIGIAENMDDSQQIMNGHARMAIDNLALAGSLVFDIDESALVG